MSNNEYIVQSNTQLTVGDLRIGVGNIRTNLFDVTSDTQGLSAGLWLYVRNKPEADRQVRVSRGQQITIDDYVLDVLDISESDGAGEVVLRVVVQRH